MCRFLRLLRWPRSTTTDRPRKTTTDRPRPTTTDRPRAVTTDRPGATRTNRPRAADRPPATATGRAGPAGRQNTGRHYRSAGHRQLCASQVREQGFGRSRNGLDPGEVDGFLHRIADELTALHAELARTREENARIKGALRDWQSRFAPRVVRA